MVFNSITTNKLGGNGDIPRIKNAVCFLSVLTTQFSASGFDQLSYSSFKKKSITNVYSTVIIPLLYY